MFTSGRLILIFFGFASGMTTTPTRQFSLSSHHSSSDSSLPDDKVTVEQLEDNWSVTSTVKQDSIAEIRCYCNTPECVSTSYMCKSKVPGCFSDLRDSQSIDKAIHGCLDSLPSHEEVMCQNSPGGEGLGVQHSLLLCCREDLCNHVDSVNRMTYNESFQQDENIRSTYSRRTPGYSSQEVWFKAATIAVPICGFLILLVLIVLAMKILRTDPQALPPKLWAKDSTAGLLSGTLVVGHNAGSDASCCGSKKVPLLFQPNDCSRSASDPSKGGLIQEKNEANAKLNNPMDLIDLHKANLRAPCNIYQPLIAPARLSPVHASQNNVFAHPNGWPLKNS